MQKIFLLLFLLGAGQVFPQTPKMLDAFRVNGERLGNPKPVSPTPQRCAAPRDYGWWQAFDQGEVYYTPTLGASSIKEPILSIWASSGKIQGTLGFPVFNVIRDRTGNNETVDIQTFERGKISYNYVTRQNSITYNQNNVTPGRYRLILCGFKVEQETSDNPFESDGKGDEIYIRTDAFITDKYGNTTNAPSYQTKVMGDVNGQENRIMAGTRGDQGGLRTGDLFPLASPWRVTTLPPSIVGGGNRLPMKIWEGEINYGNYLLVIPSIWEWDEYRPSNIENNWNRLVNQVLNYAPYEYYYYRISQNQPASIDNVNGNLPLGRMASGNSTEVTFSVNSPYVIANHQGFYFGDMFQNNAERRPNINSQGPDIFEAVFQNYYAPFGTYRMYLKWEKISSKLIPGKFPVRVQ